ncbi:MAG: hypothetical protein WCH59_09130 [Chitinophagia bacterium]
MFKNGKSGVYKTSTKSLQNLWKTDTNGVQNILSELAENTICELEIGENIVFTNRRMVREAEISEKRTKAVQTRYKTSTNQPTKTLQTPEYENEYENETENVIRGVWGEFSNELTLIEIGSTKEYVSITAQRELSESQILEYWKAYLIHSADIRHISRTRQLQHFRNWLKLQPNEKPKRNNTIKDASAPGTVRAPL